jgi:phosphoribosyl 1,2-cyclic phosphodiesterase
LSAGSLSPAALTGQSWISPALIYFSSAKILVSLQFMSLYIASLNSGSNGNCYYVGNDREAILVDAGISCREIEKRMRRLGLHAGNVKAIFISHEHSDHIRGLTVLSARHQIPVYITPSTMRLGRLQIDPSLVRSFGASEPVAVGGLSVTCFPKFHDAADPYSFTVEGGGTRVGVFTDLGLPCKELIRHFSTCHAAFLESNYDEDMLEKGNYPYHLKNRIRGGRGHLSNSQALDVFKRHRHPFLSHLLLSHLSRNNNSPELVEEIFRPHAGATKVVIASRYEESAVYHIEGIGGKASAPLKKHIPPGELQYSLF